tara:strand:- start:172 stop:498 length:327 start_codon:yes stop_codon:yes gene_type:complete
MYTEIAIDYLDNFSKKNIENISANLSNSVTLRDWDTEVHGKEEVLRFMQDLFNKVNTISVNVYKTYEVDQTVLVEMEILINEDNSLLVTDIIDFNNDNLIESIRAYLG